MNKNIVIHHRNFDDFAEMHKNVPFRFWVYRRMYTPLEQEKKYSDESFFEEDICTVAYIRECITLPDGDILIGFENVEYVNSKDSKDRPLECINYHKLSNIALEQYDGDFYDSQYK